MAVTTSSVETTVIFRKTETEEENEMDLADQKEDIQELNMALSEHIADYRFFGTEQDELASHKLEEVNKKMEILVQQRAEQASTRQEYEGLQLKYSVLQGSIRNLNEKIIRLKTEQEVSKTHSAELEQKLEEMTKNLRATSMSVTIVEQQLKLKEEFSKTLYDAWKDDLDAAISDIKKQYKNRENRLRKEYETSLTARIEIAREEESAVSWKQCALLEIQLADAKARYGLMEQQYEALLASYEDKTKREERTAERNSLIIELEEMKSERVSMKEEIKEYRKLLKAAEKRFNLVVERYGGKVLALEDGFPEIVAGVLADTTEIVSEVIKFQEVVVE